LLLLLLLLLILQVSLKYFEEVFTTQHWMMRVYRVRDQPNRDTPKDSGRAAARKTKKA
jgi:dolichyl-diphosphooligosaccharide--protein glycosyltransferase